MMSRKSAIALIGAAVALLQPAAPTITRHGQ